MTLSYQVFLLDTPTGSTMGNLVLRPQEVEFAGTGKMSLVLCLKANDIRAVAVAPIGKRENSALLLEMTVYMTDPTVFHTFSRIPAVDKEKVMNFMMDTMQLKVIDRTYDARGWNWGQLSVSSCAITFMPEIEELEQPLGDSGEQAEGDNQEGSGDESTEDDISLDEDPVERLFFHIPTANIEDFKSLGTRDLSLSLKKMPGEGQGSRLAELIFSIPEKEEHSYIYSAVSRVVDKSTSGRILSIPDVTVFTTKSMKCTLELNVDSFRLFSASLDLIFRRDSLLRYVFVEKQNERDDTPEYFLIVIFAQGQSQGICKGSDKICFALTSKKLTREVIIPEDEHTRSRLLQVFKMDDTSRFGYSLDAPEENEPFGPESLFTKSSTSRHACLWNAEMYLVIPRIFYYLNPGKGFIFTERSQSVLGCNTLLGGIHFRAFGVPNPNPYLNDQVSYVRCRYAPMKQKTMYLYFLDARYGLLLAPYSSEYIPYRVILRVSIESDGMRDDRVKLCIHLKGQPMHEFLDIPRDYTTSIVEYFSDVVHIADVKATFQATSKVHLDPGSGFEPEEESEDQDYHDVPAEESSSYDEDSGVSTEHSERSIATPEAQAFERAQNRRQAFEIYEDIRPQDCLLTDIPFPSTWPSRD